MGKEVTDLKKVVGEQTKLLEKVVELEGRLLTVIEKIKK